MQINLDFRSGQPIYVQIMAQIQQLIASGALKPGDQLPTVRQLATELRVNFNTVARAYRLLDEAGLISTQQGRGTYIWERPSEAVIDQLRKQSLQNLTRRYMAEAYWLEFSADEVREAVQKELHTWEENAAPNQPEKSNPSNLIS